VRVPEDAGSGVARVTFSFETWSEGKVSSSTIELPIAEPEKTKAKD
jgi:hypothetical protein